MISSYFSSSLIHRPSSWTWFACRSCPGLWARLAVLPCSAPGDRHRITPCAARHAANPAACIRSKCWQQKSPSNARDPPLHRHRCALSVRSTTASLCGSDASADRALFLVLGRRRRTNNRRIDDRAGLHADAFSRQMQVHCAEQRTAEFMPFEQLTEAQHGRFIRCWSHAQVEASEPPQRGSLVNASSRRGRTS